MSYLVLSVMSILIYVTVHELSLSTINVHSENNFTCSKQQHENEIRIFNISFNPTLLTDLRCHTQRAWEWGRLR